MTILATSFLSVLAVSSLPTRGVNTKRKSLASPPPSNSKRRRLAVLPPPSSLPSIPSPLILNDPSYFGKNFTSECLEKAALDRSSKFSQSILETVWKHPICYPTIMTVHSFSPISSTPFPPVINVSRLPARGPNTKTRRLDLSPSPSSSPSISSPLHLHNFSFFGKNFTSIRMLGEGCFGQVKEVQSKHSSAKFAIKCLKVDKMKVKTGLNYTKMHLNEVRIQSNSSIPSHTNIIQLYKSWKEDRSVYIQLELCQDSLDGYWRKVNCLTQSDINSVIYDMQLALNHLSSLDIVHLDVKPDNILRTEEGRYKLADFSVAFNLKMDSWPEEFGDGKFAAPEILTDHVTTKADIFSLGITFEGPLQLNKILQSMILDHSIRPSVEELIVSTFDLILEDNACENMDCNPVSSSHEKDLIAKENALEYPGVLFYKDPKFLEMERPNREQLSKGRSSLILPRSRGLFGKPSSITRLSFDDDE